MDGRLKTGAIAFIASGVDEARDALARLVERYGSVAPEEADVIVALGGDGLMLQTLHAFMNTGKPIYGMNCGSVGFLMNEFREEDAARAPRPRHPQRRPSAAHGRGRRRRHRAPRLRHQRGVAVPPVLSGGQAEDHHRRQGAAGGPDLRRHSGGDAGRQHRLQHGGARADPADLRAAAGAHPAQRLPPAHLARRPAARPRQGPASTRSRPTSGR